MLNKKFTVRQTVLIIYLVDILFAVASIIYVLKDRYLGYIVYGILLTIVIVFVMNTSIVYDWDNLKNEKE